MSETLNKEEEDEEGEEEEDEEEKKETESISKSGMGEAKKDDDKTKSAAQEEIKSTFGDHPRVSSAKKYRFEDLEPTHRPIFNTKSKSIRAEERFSMSAQEYLDAFKVSTILQDAFKTILDRRGDNAKTLFVQYLDSTLKGEHILLREHAFINASSLNRKCFLQQVRKVFHTTPWYKVVTALDYLQLLTLIWSDFPKSLMIEAVKVLPVSESSSPSTQTGEEILFEKYDLFDLQWSIWIFFYFHEFMDGVKTIFQESQKSSGFDPEEECSVLTIYTAACNFVQRQKGSLCPLPTVENIIETLIYDTKLIDRLRDEPLVLADDISSELSGSINYRKFWLGMIKNKNLILSIYDPVFNKRLIEKIDTLKKMAEEHTQVTMKEQIKRTKSKKRKA